MKPYGLTGAPLTCKYGCCFAHHTEQKHLVQYAACKRAHRKKERQKAKKVIDFETEI